MHKMEYALLCNFGEKPKVGDTSPIPPSIRLEIHHPLKMITKHNKNNNVYTVYLLLNSL